MTTKTNRVKCPTSICSTAARVRHTSASLMMMLLMTVFLLILAKAKPVGGSHSSIKLESNGYSGLVISFDEDIPPAKRRDLIRSTQELIRTSSKYLFQVTSGRAYFKSVTLLLPKSWSIGHKWDATVKRTRSLYAKDADIMIHAEDKVFKGEALTLQFAGCGKPGLRLDLPEKFVSESMDENGSAKSLVHEWFHYRYGVFDERGFAGDAVYPTHYSIPGSDGIKISSCASKASGSRAQLVVVSKNKYGQACNLSVNVDNGFPETKNGLCYPVVNLDANSDVVSSFMYQEQLPNVGHICDNSTHNQEAPTKQNLLCEGRSIWDVLMDHPDFRRRAYLAMESKQEPPHTGFKLLEMDSARIIFIVDVQLNRSEDVGDLIKHFLENLPSGSKEIIYDYQSSTNTTHGSVSTFFQVIGHGPLSSVCLMCSIRPALEWLQREISEDSESGGEVILLTEGRISDSDQTLDRIADELIRSNLKLKVIVYSSLVGDLFKLEYLVSKVRGEMVIIREEVTRGVPSLTSSSTTFKLWSALEGFKEWNNKTTSLVQEQTFLGRNISFEFLIDQSIKDSDSELFVFLLVPNERTFVLKRNTIRLTHSGGEATYGAQNSMSNLMGLKQGRGFRVEPSFTGSWKLTCEIPEVDILDPFVAVAVAIPKKEKELIRATCWIENVNEDKDAPLLVYVFVRRGYNQYARDLKVTVTVYNETSAHIVQTTEMYDDGNGDPDITKGDGIYSVYVNAPSTASYYSVKATVVSTRDSNMIAEAPDIHSVPSNKDRCCGSSIVGDSLVEVNYVHRIVQCGNFFLRRNSERYNYFGILSTLRVLKVDQNSRDVVFLFKIPYGDIRSYEFRFFTQDEYALVKTDKFSEIGALAGLWNYNNSGNSAKYGEVKNVIFRVPYVRGGFYHFAIKTTGYGNIVKYRVSNVVSFYMKEDPNFLTTNGPRPTVLTTPTDAAISSEASLNSSWQILALVALSLIFFVSLAALIICCVLSAKRRRNDQRSKFPNIASPVPDLNSKQNLSVKVNNHVPSECGKEPLPEAETTLPDLSEALSPVQSFSADLLLNHYDKVQQAKMLGEIPPVMRVENIVDNVSLSNTSRIRESISDEDNMGPRWQYDSTIQSTPHYNQYFPQDWTNAYLNRSHTPSDYDPRYGQRDRKSGSAVSQV